MTPIDLFDFTDSKKKIPAQILKFHGPQKASISNFRAMAALMLDFTMVFATTIMLSTMLKIYFSSFMISGHLQIIMENVSFYRLSVSSLPFMFMSYFFFANFFNHGQSWGMHVMKTRVQMPEQSFRASFLWAIFASSTLMSFGLFFKLARNFFEKKGWGTFEGHDHLYINLIQQKDFSPVNLLELSSHHTLESVAKEEVEESYAQAA